MQSPSMALPTPMLLLLSALLVGLLCSPAVAVEEATNNVLFNERGARLNSGESLRNGKFRLTMRRDCNLVLEEILPPMIFPPLTRMRWMSNTSSDEPRADRCYLEVSPRGSINIKEHHQNYGVRVNVFSCGNPGKVGMYALVLRADGRFGTYGRRIWSIDADLPSDAKRRGILHSGYEKTGRGTILRDGKNELLIDENDRLVTQIYGRDGKVAFRYDVSPEYAFQGQPHFEFRTSGELVYSDLRVRENENVEIKHQVWSSGVTSNAVDHICALPDLSVYGLRQLVYNGATAICGVVLPQPRNGGLLSDE